MEFKRKWGNLFPCNVMRWMLIGNCFPCGFSCPNQKGESIGAENGTRRSYSLRIIITKWHPFTIVLYIYIHTNLIV